MSFRKWLTERAFRRIIIDRNLLDTDDLWYLAVASTSEMNSRRKDPQLRIVFDYKDEKK